MPMTRIDENELLAPLQLGPLEESAWLIFLARLRRRARADYAGLLHGQMEGTGKDARELFVGQPGLMIERQGWQAAFHRRDPLPHRRLRAGRVHGDGEFPDPTDPAHTGYDREVMAAAGFVDQRVVRVTEPGGACFWLMVARGTGRFGAAESALLGGLAPHLEIALKTSAALATARRQAALSGRAAARLGLGWMTLDGLGRPIEGGGSALPASLHDRMPPVGTLPQTIRIGEDPCFDVHIEPLAATGSIHDPATIVHHRRSGVCGPDPIGALIGLHGLSRSEARLAWALCEGRSIGEAAGAIGLTIETARNYSKRIYAKTGASGQADLVRIILSGIAPLA